MKRVILVLTLILTISAPAGNQRRFKIAFFLPGNGSTQYTVVEAPDAMTAQQIFKATCRECKFSSYTELK